MLPNQKLDALVTRHAALERDLAAALPAETYVKLSREFAELAPVVEAVRYYRAAQRELDDLAALIADPTTDPEMRAIAEAEKPDVEKRCAELEQKLRLALLPKDAMDERNVILEIRAGTGGDEAALFAGNLFRMYERYAAKHGWKVEIVAASDGSMGGYKEIVAEIRGRGAFSKLKYESGVHRVQRVPDTEASGRIHTSTATVAVLPEAQDLDVAINDADLKIDTLRSSGAGGQHVNKTESAVRVTHIPSGIVVMMQEDRSQHRNRAKALAVLRTRLYDHERQKQDAARAAERRGQVGTGDRSERIRTYNYPQGRVSEHRINLTLYKLPQILEAHEGGQRNQERPPLVATRIAEQAEHRDGGQQHDQDVLEVEHRPGHQRGEERGDQGRDAGRPPTEDLGTDRVNDHRQQRPEGDVQHLRRQQAVAHHVVDDRHQIGVVDQQVFIGLSDAGENAHPKARQRPAELVIGAVIQQQEAAAPQRDQDEMTDDRRDNAQSEGGQEEPQQEAALVRPVGAPHVRQAEREPRRGDDDRPGLAKSSTHGESDDNGRQAAD